MTSARGSLRLAAVMAIVRRIIGMPDYEAYLRHLRECHPEREPLSRKAYYEDFVKRRYEGGPTRCC